MSRYQEKALSNAIVPPCFPETEGAAKLAVKSSRKHLPESAQLLL